MTLRQQIADITTTINSLRSLADNDIISDNGTTICELMQRRFDLQKEFILKRHTSQIVQKQKTKNGKKIEYWWTEVRKNDGGYKQITSITEEGLIDKLYQYYGNNNMSNVVTLSDAYRVWYKDMESDAKSARVISGRTWDDYNTQWRRFWQNSAIADKNIQTIKVKDITSVIKMFVGNGKITKKAFHKATNVLNLVYDTLVEEGIVDYNFSRQATQITSKKLKFKAVKKQDGDYYSREERDTLLQYLYDLPKQTVYTLAVSLSACLGKRIGEFTALTWDNYDAQAKTLKIEQQIVLDYATPDSTTKTYQVADHLKGYHESQEIPLSDYAVSVIEQLKIINGNKKYILNSKGEKPITTSHFNEHLHDYCNACGIKYYSSHKFRYYGTSEMYAQDIPELQISAYLNHTDIETTRIYDRRVKTGISHETAESVFGFTPA